MNKVEFNPKTMELSLFDEKDNFLGTLNLKDNELENGDIEKKIDRYRLEVSLCCDLACKYCIVHMNRVSQQGNLMSMEIAQEIVEKYNKEVGDKGSIFLMGGEPLLNWDVVKYIIENVKGSTIIFTNSYKLNQEKIEFFKKHNTYILTSLDGYSEKHNEARFYPKVSERFNIVTENIKNAIKNECNVGVSCVVHQDNYKDLKDIAEYFTKDLKTKSMSFAYPHLTVEESMTNSFKIENYTEKICNLVEFSRINKVYIDQIGKKVSSILNKKRIDAACKVGISQRTFFPDGKETHCTKLETIENYSIDEFITKLPVVNKKCKECIAVNLCGGGCPWDAAISKSSSDFDDRICIYNNNLIKAIIDDIDKNVCNAKDIQEAREIIKEKYVPMTNPNR